MLKLIRNLWLVILLMMLPMLAVADASGSRRDHVKPNRILTLLSGLKQHSSDEKTSLDEFEFAKSWLDQQPVATGGKQWECLSEALYFEVRGETVKGQFAVAEVVINRVASARFPDTVCGVINQGSGRKYQCQFTYTCDGLPEDITNKTAFNDVSKVARAVLDKRAPNLTKGATHYHTKFVSPRWSRVYKKTTSIGVHFFYRHNFRTASK